MNAKQIMELRDVCFALVSDALKEDYKTHSFDLLVDTKIKHMMLPQPASRLVRDCYKGIIGLSKYREKLGMGARRFFNDAVHDLMGVLSHEGDDTFVPRTSRWVQDYSYKFMIISYLDGNGNYHRDIKNSMSISEVKDLYTQLNKFSDKLIFFYAVSDDDEFRMAATGMAYRDDKGGAWEYPEELIDEEIFVGYSFCDYIRSGRPSGKYTEEYINPFNIETIIEELKFHYYLAMTGLVQNKVLTLPGDNSEPSDLFVVKKYYEQAVVQKYKHAFIAKDYTPITRPFPNIETLDTTEKAINYFIGVVSDLSDLYSLAMHGEDFHGKKRGDREDHDLHEIIDKHFNGGPFGMSLDEWFVGLREWFTEELGQTYSYK